MYYTEQMCLPCSSTKDEIQWLEKRSAAHRVLVEHEQGDNLKQQLTLGKHFILICLLGKSLLRFIHVLITTTLYIFAI